MKLRVLTWNIHKAIGGIDRRYRPERVCEVIAHHDPDFALLQEVDAGARRSRGHDQTDLLGCELGYRHRVWFPNHRVRSGGAYGNAILSRWPLTHTANIDLTMPRHKRRSVLHARARVRLGQGGRRLKTVHLFNLHLGLSGLERKRQLRRFLDSQPFAGLDHRTPVLVGGDFNDVYGTLGRLLLAPAGFRGMPRRINTFPAIGPVRALDAVYLRGHARLMHVERSRLAVARRASDHLPLVADLVVTS